MANVKILDMIGYDGERDKGISTDGRVSIEEKEKKILIYQFRI